MIESIINAIPFDQHWIEKKGGLVRTARKSFPIDEESNLFIEKKYPISSNVSAKECFDNGKYSDLMPDSRYKSICYFEQTSPTLPQSNINLGSEAFVFETNVKFVCWLNLNLLGFDVPDKSEIFQLEMYKFFSKIKFLVNGIHGIKIKFISFGQKNENPFSNYSYENIEGLLLYPFDFFVINLTIQYNVKIDCIESVPVLTPIIC